MTPAQTQQTLFDAPSVCNHTHLLTDEDCQRLQTQYARVENAMKAGRWTTLFDLSRRLRREYPGCYFPECSLSARLRDMRRAGWKIDRRLIANGLFTYRASLKKEVTND